MADFVLSADDVGHIVQYIAPGFFARVAYEARFPAAERSALSVVVWSVAASLPLVAIAKAIADGLGIQIDVADWKYVLLLLGLAALAGYLTAAARSWTPIRTLLAKIGLHHQPDGSLYALTMLGLSPAAVVVVETQDGRKVSGTPRAGPSYAEDAVNEIVLTHPEWMTLDGWSAEGAGAALLVPLETVKSITFSEDPFR